MKKFFVTLALTAAIFFGNGNFSCGEAFAAINDESTRYKISAPKSVAVTSLSRNGGRRIEHRNENFAQEVLRLVNEERARVGVTPLRLADDLQAATAIRAREIVGYFSHTRPNGSDCFTVMRNRGRTCGENIAAGNSSASATVEQWMNSAGHRKNILNPAFRELGVGYFYAENSTYRHYWVQLFRG